MEPGRPNKTQTTGLNGIQTLSGERPRHGPGDLCHLHHFAARVQTFTG